VIGLGRTFAFREWAIIIKFFPMRFERSVVFGDRK